MAALAVSGGNLTLGAAYADGPWRGGWMVPTEVRNRFSLRLDATADRVRHHPVVLTEVRNRHALCAS